MPTALRVLGCLALLAPAAPALPYQERLVLSEPDGACTLRLEADDGSRTLRLRISPEASGCRPSREAVTGFLERAFARVGAPGGGGAWTSLYLGRLEDLQWLSDHLASTAERDPRWDRKKGRPVKGDPNGYVASILSAPEVTAPFDAALQGAGYRVASASVEKVLVRGKVPVDAQTWFRLARAGGP
jgi:hypothetical protein